MKSLVQQSYELMPISNRCEAYAKICYDADGESYTRSNINKYFEMLKPFSYGKIHIVNQITNRTMYMKRSIKQSGFFVHDFYNFFRRKGNEEIFKNITREPITKGFDRLIDITTELEFKPDIGMLYKPINKTMYLPGSRYESKIIIEDTERISVDADNMSYFKLYYGGNKSVSYYTGSYQFLLLLDQIGEEVEELYKLAAETVQEADYNNKILNKEMQELMAPYTISNSLK